MNQQYISNINNIDIEIVDTDYLYKEIEVKNQSDNTDFSFVGFTAKMSIRDDNNAVVGAFTTTDNSIVLSSGLITLTKGGFDAVEGRYKYDLQLTQTSTGIKETILKGEVRIYKQIT